MRLFTLEFANSKTRVQFNSFHVLCEPSLTHRNAFSRKKSFTEKFKIDWKWFLPERRSASAGTSYGHVSVCLCRCLCLSVTSLSSIETDGRIELVFGVGASFHLSYTVLKGNSGIFKMRVIPSGTLTKIPDFKNFASAYRSLKRVINLAWQWWTPRAW